MATEIDGSILEGGGQILRNCIAYAAILGQNIQITDIRGKRPKPGLRRQHLSGILLTAQLVDAVAENVELNATKITFSPRVTDRDFGEHAQQTVYNCDIGTAGACSLVLQTILPVLLVNTNVPKTFTVNITGGTNVPNSPPMDYLLRVLLPILSRHCQQPIDDLLEIRMLKRGFTPLGGGMVEMIKKERSTASRTPWLPIRLMNRGQVVSFSCYIFDNIINTEQLRDKFNGRIQACEQLNGFPPLQFVMDQSPPITKPGPHGAMMVAETDTGCIIAGSSLGGKNTPPDRLAMICLDDFVRQWSAGGCVDEHLADQLIIFMALSNGRSEIVAGYPISLHTETAIHFARVMTGAAFTVEQIEKEGRRVAKISCQGINML